MTDICPLVQVRTADAAALQLRLHRLRALSTAVLSEQLSRPFPMQVGRPFVKKGDLAGVEIGTAMSKLADRIAGLKLATALSDEQTSCVNDLEAELAVLLAEPRNPNATAAELSAVRAAAGGLRERIAMIRMAGARTPGQDVLLSELECRYRTLAAEATAVTTGTRATGHLGRYSYRIPTIEIRTGTETERYETAEIELIIGDATRRVRGAHAALLALYGPRGLEQAPAIDHATRGQLRRNTDVPAVAHRYWEILLDWAELIRMESERHRAGVTLKPTVATGISDEYRERIRARYRAA